MTSKRLRVDGVSSSISDIDLVSSYDDAAASRQLPINPNKYMKPSLEFFIAPPPPSVYGQQPIGFLEKCNYCNKKTPPGTKIFMYRDFCAFCSEECRAVQIAQDELEAKQRDLSKKRINFVSK